MSTVQGCSFLARLCHREDRSGFRLLHMHVGSHGTQCEQSCPWPTQTQSRVDLMQSQQAGTADLKVAGDILTRQALHIHEVQNALGHSFCGSRQALVMEVAKQAATLLPVQSNKETM